MDTTDLGTRIAAICDLVDEVRGAASRLEVGHCDVDQLAVVKGVANCLGTISDVLKTDVAVRAEELRQVDENDVVDATLNPDGRSSSREEQIERDRGGVLDSLPDLDDATRAGELSAAYADVVARAVAGLSPKVRTEFFARHQDLAERAATLSVPAFRREVSRLIERLLADVGVQREERQRHQRRASTFTDLHTGMWGLSGRWDPLTGHRIGDAITTELNALYRTRRDDPHDRRTREQLMADAISNLICGTPVSRQTHAAGATVVIITDQRTADAGPHDQSVHEYADGSPVAFDTLADLLAEPTTATVEAIVNDHGVVQSLGDEVLDEGRNNRCATPAQRLALRAMHRTCIFPGCDVPFDACEQHHLLEWQHDGRTDLVDLGPSCSRHHHRLHAHSLATALRSDHSPPDDHLPRRHRPHPPLHRTRPTQQHPPTTRR